VVVHNWRAGAAAVLILASCVLLVGNLRAWMTTRPGRRGASHSGHS
jgi:hypothetical protein